MTAESKKLKMSLKDLIEHWSAINLQFWDPLFGTGEGPICWQAEFQTFAYNMYKPFCTQDFDPTHNLNECEMMKHRRVAIREGLSLVAASQSMGFKFEHELRYQIGHRWIIDDKS